MILESGVGNYITIHGKKYSYFAGNNYLGLANHAEIKKDVIAAIQKYGLNFSASRATTGTSDLHLLLEERLSRFKDREEAVVFASGYLGNKILLHTLREQFDAVFVDESAHPSIFDAVPGDVSRLVPYRHLEIAHLENLLERYKSFRPLIITDGLFALTGEIAPLDQIYELARKYNAILVVDDAHATGVLGDHGRGTPEHFGLDGIYQTETMSKALGAYGGFIAGSSEIVQKIRNDSSIYIGTTSLPAPVTAAGLATVTFFLDHPELRKTLSDNGSALRNRIKKLGFSTSSDSTPIVPLFFKTAETAQHLSDFLLDQGIVAPKINYPVKTGMFIVRLTVSASHTVGQIEQLCSALKKWRDHHFKKGDQS